MDLTEFVSLSPGASFLILGEPGTGKTPAVTALLPDYKIRAVITGPNARALAARAPAGSDVKIISAVDPNIKQTKDGILDTVPSKTIPKKWSQINQLALGVWEGDDGQKEDMSTWGEDTVLVFDDLTGIGEEPNSPPRIYAQWAKGKLGQKLVGADELRIVGEAQSQISRLTGGILAMNRKFHVVMNCHLRRITVDVTRRLTEEEIRKKSVENNQEKPKMTESLTTYDRYPIVCGAALSMSFARSFDWVVQTRHEGRKEPVVLITPPDDDWDVMLRNPLPIDHPLITKPKVEKGKSVGCEVRPGVFLPVSTALPRLIKEHITFVKRNN
jgi:hypothetical protein